MEKLQREIEIVRRKLDEAIRDGYDEGKCYELSVELDRLIERYIDADSCSDAPKTEDTTDKNTEVSV